MTAHQTLVTAVKTKQLFVDDLPLPFNGASRLTGMALSNDCNHLFFVYYLTDICSSSKPRPSLPPSLPLQD